MKRIIRYIGVPLASLAAVAATAAPAFASSTPTSAVTPTQIAQLQSDINARITFLDTLSGRIQSSKTLTQSDAATLAGVVGSSSSGDIAAMQSLLASVPSITTEGQLHLTYETLYDNYRIYAVVGPQVDLTIAQDQILSISSELINLEPTLNSLIASNGNNPTATAAYANLVTSAAQAQSTASGLGSYAVSLTPTIYNTDPTGTHTTITNDWQQLKGASANIKTARSDISTIMKNV